MDLKKFLIVAAIFACPALYAQTASYEAMDALFKKSKLICDFTYVRGTDSILSETIRGGFYVTPRIGFEHNYIPKSGTNFPALSAEFGLGYMTRTFDARVHVGMATCEYGNLSDKKAWYLAPRFSVELLYVITFDKDILKQNFLKIGAGVDYTVRRTYVDNELCEFRLTSSVPRLYGLVEYERQFWGSRSSIAIGAKFGTDNEIGNGIRAWGIAGGVYVSYRIGVQKKKIWNADSDAK